MTKEDRISYTRPYVMHFGPPLMKGVGYLSEVVARSVAGDFSTDAIPCRELIKTAAAIRRIHPQSVKLTIEKYIEQGWKAGFSADWKHYTGWGCAFPPDVYMAIELLSESLDDYIVECIDKRSAAMKRISCAFTGHRPGRFPWKYDEKDERCLALKAALHSQIAECVSDGVTDFLSGMAEGVDVWAALSVLRLREENPALKLHCILPCTTQADGWSRFAQERYHRILQQADSIVYVSRAYHNSCMMERNRFMVGHASILLAVCEDENTRRSGTAATVRYARKTGREIILLNPLSLQIHRESGRFENRNLYS